MLQSISPIRRPRLRFELTVFLDACQRVPRCLVSPGTPSSFESEQDTAYSEFTEARTLRDTKATKAFVLRSNPSLSASRSCYAMSKKPPPTKPSTLPKPHYEHDDIELLDTFLVGVLGKRSWSSRADSLKDETGFLLTPGTHKRVPGSVYFPLPLEVFSGQDEVEIGAALFFLADFFCFERAGPLLVTIDDVGGYLIESTVDSPTLLSYLRTMNGHLIAGGLSENYTQVRY